MIKDVVDLIKDYTVNYTAVIEGVDILLTGDKILKNYSWKSRNNDSYRILG